MLVHGETQHYGSFSAEPVTVCSSPYNATDTTSTLEESTRPLPRLYKRRFFVLFQFCVLSFSSAFLWITFSPCIYIFSEHYNVSTTAISWLSLIYMAVYVIAILPCLYVSNVLPTNPTSVRGIRTGLLIAAKLNVIGAGLRYAGKNPDGFVLLFVGQVFAAVAQVFILGIPPRLATVWFHSTERNTATSVGIVSNSVGVAAGFLTSPAWIHKPEDISGYLGFQFVLCTAILLLLFTSLQSHPPTAPSPFAMSQSHQQTTEDRHRALLDIVKSLFRKKSFRYLWVSYGVAVGGCYAVSTLLAQIVLPAFPEIGEETLGLVGLLMVLSGVLSGLLVGIFLDYTGSLYQTVGRFLYCVCICTIVSVQVAVEYGTIRDVVVSSAMYGTFSAAIIPATFQYAGELFFPIDEDIIAGLLNSSAQIFGIFLTGIMQLLESDKRPFTMKLAIQFFLAVSVLGFILQWLVNGRLLRKETEEMDESTEPLLV